MEITKEQQAENEAFFKVTAKIKYDELGHVYLDERNLLYIFSEGIKFAKDSK